MKKPGLIAAGTLVALLAGCSQYTRPDYLSHIDSFSRPYQIKRTYKDLKETGKGTPEDFIYLDRCLARNTLREWAKNEQEKRKRRIEHQHVLERMRRRYRQMISKQ